MKKYLTLLLILSFVCGCETNEPEKKEEQKPVVIDETKPNTVNWSKWQEGYLDIHHLSTGAGDCIYIVMPDGTTMMIDAGNKIENDNNHPGQVPNASKTTGGWIENYVSHFENEAGFTNKKHIDYMLVTHFHDDHIGSINSDSRCTPSKDGTYSLTGVSEVGNLLTIDKIIDRDYPDYSHPAGNTEITNSTTQNYINFVKSYVKDGGKAEKFVVGSNEQFKPLKKTVNGFEIRNVYSTGVYWDKNGGVTSNTIPENASAEDLRENLMCCVINISYGKFDYHCGGDIESDSEDTSWKAVEKRVGALIGETDVVKLNHHGNENASCKEFFESTTPQVAIATIRSTSMPSDKVGERFLLQSTYSGTKDLYTGILSTEKEDNWVKRGFDVKPAGHTVVRVYQGGSTFRIFVFDFNSTNFYQVYSSKLYTSK